MTPVRITSVLVPVDPEDGSGRAAEAAIEVASDLARRIRIAGEQASGPGGTDVTLVAVDPLAVPLVDLHGYLSDLADLSARADGTAVATRVDVTTRSVAAHLAQAPVEGEVVCMATHGRTRFGALFLGSVADAVVRRTTAPVLLVGPHWQTSDLDRPVVAALDGSERDGSVVDAAVGWARDLGVDLVLTTVITSPSEPSSWVTADGILAAAADQADGLGVAVTLDPVAAGDPASGLLAATAGAGCLVVGSRRRSAIQALAGSTVHGVVRRSPVPVLVAP